MARRLRTRRTGLRSNRGQVLALYALAVPVLLAILALALDGGKLFVYHIHLQNAADAASLASAQDLGPCWQGACTAAEQASVLQKVKDDVNCYARNNNAPLGNCGPPPWQFTQMTTCNQPWDEETAQQRAGDMNCFMWPYDTTATPGGQLNWDKVEVRLRRTVSLSFGGLPGIPSTSHPSARAVGTFQQLTVTTAGSTVPDLIIPGQTHTETFIVNGTTTVQTTTIPGQTHTLTNVTGGSCPPGGNCGVAFAASTSCQAVQWTGSKTGQLGSLMTNGGFFSNGNSNKSLDYLYVGRLNDCFNNQAPVAIAHPPVGPFTPQPFPIPPPPVPTPIPIGQPRGANECWDLGTNGFNFSNANSPSGVYCLTGGTLTLNSDLTTKGHTFTFFAPDISVSGGKYQFYSGVGQPQTVLYSSGNISIQGGGSAITGDIFAPSGQISIQGSGVSGGKGFIESQTIKIAGNFASYEGLGPLQGGTLTTTVVVDPDTTVYNTTITGGSSTEIPVQDPDTTITGTTIDPVTQTTGTNFGLGE